MAQTFIRQSGSSGYTSSLTHTISASAAGNALIAVVLHQSGTAMTITSNAGGTWQKATSTEALASGQYKVDIWYLLDAPSTTSVAVATGASTSALAINVSEYSGVTSLSAVDAKYGNSGDPDASVTAVSGDLIISGLAYYNSEDSATVAAPFTRLGAAGLSTTRLASARGIANTDGPITPGWTYPVAGSYASRGTVLAAFMGAEAEPPAQQPTGYVLTANGWVGFVHKEIGAI